MSFFHVCSISSPSTQLWFTDWIIIHAQVIDIIVYISFQYEPDLEDEDGEMHPRPVKVTKKKKAKTTIYQVCFGFFFIYQVCFGFFFIYQVCFGFIFIYYAVPLPAFWLFLLNVCHLLMFKSCSSLYMSSFHLFNCVHIQVFEPSELERSHFTDFDQEVRMADMPERFQLRDIPVCPTEDGELDEEADWIYRQAFSTPPLSK